MDRVRRNFPEGDFGPVGFSQRGRILLLECAARKSLAQFEAFTPVPAGHAPSTPVRIEPPTLFQTLSRPPRVGGTETASPGLASTPGASPRVARSLRFRSRVRPLSARVARRVPPPHAPSHSRRWHLP